MIRLKNILSYDSTLSLYFAGRLTDLRLVANKFPVTYFIYFSKFDDLFLARVYFHRNSQSLDNFKHLAEYSRIDVSVLRGFLIELFSGEYEVYVL